MPSNLYFGHGEAWLGIRNASGQVTEFAISLPQINSLSIELTRETIEHVSKRTAVAGKDLKVTRMVGASGKMSCSTHTKELLAQYLYGEVVAVSGGAFTANANVFPSGITSGQILPLPNNRTHVSSLVITDSAGAPATLALGTNYEIVDPDAGLIKFLNITGFTQPFKAAGTEAPGANVSVLTRRVLERWLRFKGINIANDDKIVVVDLYRCQFEPASDWKLLNDGSDVNSYELNFEALIDPTKPATDPLGQYGRYRELS